MTTTARIALALAVGLALLGGAGCPDDGDVVCGGGAATAACSEDLDSRGACLAEGGCWGIWGLSPGPSCNCPTADAGVPCTSAADCESHCLVDALGDGSCPDEGECADMQRVFGCHCLLGEDDAEETCVD